MNHYDQLSEEYEDAKFALIMYRVMQYEGALLESVRKAPADIPEELDKVCTDTIDREFRKLDAAKAHLRIRKFGKVLLVAALVASLLVGTVFAAFPNVRTKTVNFVLDHSGDFGVFLLGATKPEDIAKTQADMGKYILTFIPENFELTQGSETWGFYSELYKNGNAYIDFSVIYATESVPLKVDTEDATVEPHNIPGYDGVLIDKDGRIHVVLVDTERANYVNLVCDGLHREIVIKIAENIVYGR